MSKTYFVIKIRVFSRI